MLLGIDFGTTRTVVAAAQAGRYPALTFDIAGEFKQYIPGLAAWTGDSLVFGWDAATTPDPESARPGDAGAPGQRIRSIRSIKRLVSRHAPDEIVPGLPEPVTALELATGFLVHLRQMIVQCSNLALAQIDPEKPIRAAVAVPANASSRQRYLTLEAFSRAGFSVETMLNEPTAAAIEFAYRNSGVLKKRSPKRYVVIYDLGGGTFDTAAVSLQGRRFELLSSEGIGVLGGDDFDQIILDAALVGAGVDPQHVSPKLRPALLEACREAKESLRPNSHRLHVELDLADASGDGKSSLILDTADIYRACQPIIDRTLELVARVFSELDRHGIDSENPRELGGLYLVGGSVAFPPVARALRARYKRKIQLAPQPHAATAVGLAIGADPEAGILVKEATTRYFGVWREGQGGREKIFDPVLSKDTLPRGDESIVIERSYHPSHAVGHLRFLECTSLTADGQPDGDLTPWREVLFPYDSQLASQTDRGELAELAGQRRYVASDEITETYTYDCSGQIQVAIVNRTRGYEKTYILGTLR